MPVGMGAKVLVSVAMPPLKTRMGRVRLNQDEEGCRSGIRRSLLQSRRREHGRGEAQPGDVYRQRQGADDRGAGLAHRRRGLDPVAALSGEPEEAGQLAVEAADQVAI